MYSDRLTINVECFPFQRLGFLDADLRAAVCRNQDFLANNATVAVVQRVKIVFGNLPRCRFAAESPLAGREDEREGFAGECRLQRGYFRGVHSTGWLMEVDGLVDST